MAKKGLGIAGILIGVLLAVGGFAGMPIINSQLLEPELAGAMQTLRDEGQTEVKWMVYEGYTDDLLLAALDEVNETLQGEDNMVLFVNGSVAMQVLYGNLLLANQTQYSDWATTLGSFFSAADYWTNAPGFTDVAYFPYNLISEGVTEYAPYYTALTPAAYSAAAMGALLEGNPGFVPGIFEEDFGGYPGFVAFYEAVGPAVLQFVMSGFTDESAFTANSPYSLNDLYNTTSTQLTSFFSYVYDYLIPIVVAPYVPTIIGSELGFAVPACTADTAYDYIKLQWGTKSLLPDGLVVLSPDAEGYEVGLDTFTNFAQILGLYDEANITSLVNEDGIALWVDLARDGDADAKAALVSGTGLSASVIDEIVAWYISADEFELFAKVNVASTINDEGDYDIVVDDTFYLQLLTLQWERMLLDDEPVELEGVTGLEVNLIEADYLDKELRMNLWNDSFAYALTTEAGMEIWLSAAKGNDDSIATLVDNSDLTESQVVAIGVWILTMRDIVIPAIAEQDEIISSGMATLLSTLQDYGLYIGIAGIVLAALCGILLKKK